MNTPSLVPRPRRTGRLAGLARLGEKRALASLVVTTGSALATTLVRHFVRGRRHDAWTLSYDLAMTALRVASREQPELMLRLVNKQVAPLPRELIGKVRIAPRQLAGRDAEVHVPSAESTPLGTVLYLHGGGFVSCSPRSHRNVIARIAHAANMRCVALDYRLAPEHPFPGALDDAIAAYEALLGEQGDARRLFVAGDSAGGGLALSLLIRLRERGTPLPRGVVLLSPWVDLTLDAATLAAAAPHDYQTALRLPLNAATYAHHTPLSDPLISPLFADLEGLPPMLVQTGEWEIFCRQNERLVARARAHGVPVQHTISPGMLHAFTCFAGLTPEGMRAIAEIGSYLRGFPELERRLA